MYDKGTAVLGTSIGATAAGGMLPQTGIGIDLLWLLLGAFALIAAGLAMWRLVPRQEA
jgi:LPXTG-motif cell wall-anchored protein